MGIKGWHLLEWKVSPSNNPEPFASESVKRKEGRVPFFEEDQYGSIMDQ